MDYVAALRYFVAAAETGSFSRAALQYGVEVSTVSRQIAALEADLKAALFNRSTRSIRLTEAGLLFQMRARRILDDLAETRQAIRDWNARPQGLLRIGVPAAFGRRAAVGMVGAFLRVHAAMEVDLVFTAGPVSLIEAGLDAAIGIGRLPDSALVARRIGTASDRLVAAPALLGVLGGISDPEALAGAGRLGLAGPAGNEWNYLGADGRRGTIQMASRLRVNDLDALRDAACDGLGVALLPCWMVEDDLASGRLVPVLSGRSWSHAPDGDLPVWIVYAPKRTVSSKLRAFITHMQAALAR